MSRFETKKSRVVHAHIVPTFSRRVDNLKTIKQTQDIQPSSIQLHSQVWVKTFPVYLTPPKPQKKYQFRIAVHPISQTPFPQYHRITLSAPFIDVFLHWTHLCTPFNVRTSVRREELNLNDRELAMTLRNDGKEGKLEGDGKGDFFRGYGVLIKRFVKDCMDFPDRFIAQFEIQTETLAILTFSEIVLDYRKMKLFAIEMRPSNWDYMVNDLKDDILRIENDRSILKATFVKVIDKIARTQPSILLSGDGASALDPTPAHQPQSWSRIVQEFLVTNVRNKPDEELNRKKAFLIFTERAGLKVEAIYTKTIPVKVFESNPNDNDDLSMKDKSKIQLKNLLITIYTKKCENQTPVAYILTITTKDDSLFHFTSIEITPSAFRNLTSHLDIYNNQLELDETSLNGRTKVLGFNPTRGIGGVIGVIAGDCMNGVVDEPDRYTAFFKIDVEDGKFSDTGELPSPLKSDWKWSDIPTDTYDPKVIAAYTPTYTKSLPPKRRRGILLFKEKAFLREHEVLKIEFMETEIGIVKQSIQEKFEAIQGELNTTQEKLKIILDTVKQKSPLLMKEIHKIGIPSFWVPGKPNKFEIDKIPRLGMPSEIEYGHNLNDTPNHLAPTPCKIPVQVRPVIEPVRKKKHGIFRQRVASSKEFVPILPKKKRVVKPSSGWIAKGSIKKIDGVDEDDFFFGKFGSVYTQAINERDEKKIQTSVKALQRALDGNEGFGWIVNVTISDLLLSSDDYIVKFPLTYVVKPLDRNGSTLSFNVDTTGVDDSVKILSVEKGNNGDVCFENDNCQVETKNDEGLPLKTYITIGATVFAALCIVIAALLFKARRKKSRRGGKNKSKVIQEESSEEEIEQDSVISKKSLEIENSIVTSVNDDPLVAIMIQKEHENEKRAHYKPVGAIGGRMTIMDCLKEEAKIEKPNGMTLMQFKDSQNKAVWQRE